jgi:AcrR family transcriptional regulator
MTATGEAEAVPGREKLTRDRVLRAALRFVDANGLEALSIRRLGAELGVQGMSLYTHVGSKDALLDGLVEAMSAELEMPPRQETDWRAALRRFAASLRDLVHRHPAAAPLLASRHILPARTLDVVGAYLRVLRSAGFDARRALEVVGVVQVYAQGHALTEVSWGRPGKDPGVPADDVARLRWVAGMVPRDAPDSALKVALDYCARADMNRQFEAGLDLIIRGIEAEAPAVRPGP